MLIFPNHQIEAQPSSVAEIEAVVEENRMHTRSSSIITQNSNESKTLLSIFNTFSDISTFYSNLNNSLQEMGKSYVRFIRTICNAHG